jgi:hypothetical protein
MVVGDFVKVDGMMEDNEQLIGELKEIVMHKVLGEMDKDGLDTLTFNFEHVVRQGWKSDDGKSVGDESFEGAKPFFSVAYKGTQKR